MRRRAKARRFAAVIAIVFAVAGEVLAGDVLAPGSGVCTKADFEAVVDTIAAALRNLNLKNKPTFQEKLRALKVKRRWSHDEFIKEAAPFVRDERIAVFDEQSEQLLGEISAMGQAGADAKRPNCAILLELRERMKALVDTQNAKWSYMFRKLDIALWE